MTTTRNTVSIFVNHSGPESDAEALHSAFRSGPFDALIAAAGLRFVESYVPEPGDVPQFDEGPRPPLLVELNFASAADAGRALDSDALHATIGLGADEAATIDVYEPKLYPIPGHASPPPRTAPLSFVVRYFRPAPDEAAFIAFYTANHPLLLARFPGIRNVLCYEPAGVRLPEGVSDSGAFFGNEVVFDDLGALKRALDSDVLAELMAEGRTFPPYGHCRHHAMRRRRLYTAPTDVTEPGR